MAIQARLADGRVLNFPDGTDPEVINRTVKNLLAPAKPAETSSALQMPEGDDYGTSFLGAEEKPERKVYTGSVFDTQPFDPKFDPLEAEKLSRRAYAEKVAEPPRRTQSMRATPSEQIERTAGQAAADTAISLLQGAAGIPKGIAANINAGDNPVAKFYEEAIQAGERSKSPFLQSQKAEREALLKNVLQNQGELAQTRAAFTSMFSPAGADVVSQGAGSMLPTMGMSLLNLGQKSFVAMNALANAGEAAQNTAQKLAQMSPQDWSKSDAYQDLRSAGLSHRDAAKMLAPLMAMPSQLVGGIAGGVSGGTGLEKSLAGGAIRGGARERAARAGTEVLGEQFETLAPSLAGNITQRMIDEKTSPTEGLGREAVETLFGSTPGAALAATGRSAPDTPPELDTRGLADRMARERGFLTSTTRAERPAPTERPAPVQERVEPTFDEEAFVAPAPKSEDDLTLQRAQEQADVLALEGEAKAPERFAYIDEAPKYDTPEMRLKQAEELGGEDVTGLIFGETESYGRAALKKKSLTAGYAEKMDKRSDASDAATVAFGTGDYGVFAPYEKLFPKTAAKLKVALAPKQEVVAPPEAPVEQAEVTPPKELGSPLKQRYDKLSSRRGGMQTALRDRVITDAEYSRYLSQLNQAREAYEAENAAAVELTPLQEEASFIADKLEEAGFAGIARGMRLNIKKNILKTPESLDFYRNKLQEATQVKEQARKEGIAEDYSLSRYYNDEDSRTTSPEFLVDYRAKAPQKVRMLTDEAESLMQQLAGRINAAGFKVNDITAITGKDLMPYKRMLSELAGGASGVVGREAGVRKKYKNSNPESFKKAQESLRRDIEAARVLLEEEAPPLDYEALSAEKAPVSPEVEELLTKQRLANEDIGILSKRSSGTSLMKVLEGSLDNTEISELIGVGASRKIGKNPFASLMAKKGTRGVSIEAVIDSGKLNPFLPLKMRQGQPDYDDAESAEYIREKLRNGEFYTDDIRNEIDNIQRGIWAIEEEIQQELSLEDINREIQYAVDEQRALDQETAELAPEGAPEALDEGTREEDELLKSQTKEELKAKQDEIDRLSKENERLAKEAERKAKADEEVGDFVLTGSKRDADQAAARGQKDIFAEPAEETSADFDANKSALTKLAEKLLDKGSEEYQETELDGKLYQVRTRTFDGKLFGSELQLVKDTIGLARDVNLINEEDRVMTLQLTGKNVGEGRNVRIMDSQYTEQEDGADSDQQTFLNISASPVTGEPAKRAPSVTRRAKTLSRANRAGKISDMEFVMGVNAAIEAADDAKLNKDRPERQRGADFIRQKLLEAKRRGDISEEASDLAEWFILNNPALVDDLGISIRMKKSGGTAGQYIPFSRIMVLMKGAANDQTPVHEILHHLERMMPVDMQAAIRKEWAKQLTQAKQKAATPDERKFFELLFQHHYHENGSQNDFDKAVELIQDGKAPYEFYQYVNPSEFWAVNGSDIMQGRFDAVRGGVLQRLKSWLKELGQKVKSVFGVPSDAPLIRALDSLSKGDGEFITKEMLGEATGYAAIAGKNIYDRKPMVNWTMPDSTNLDSFIYFMQNKQIDMKRAVEAIQENVKKIDERFDPYMKETLFQGRAATQTKRFLQNELEPLFKQMGRLDVTMPELEEYLHNRHAQERNEQIAKVNKGMPDKGSGIATKDAQKYLANLSPDQEAKYKKLAGMVDAIAAGTRQLLVDSGLESQETINKWEKTYDNYIPLNRDDIDYSSNHGMGVGQGYSVRGSATRRAVGSERKVVDILANIAMQRERNIVRAEKNRVAMALYGLAIQNPNPDIFLAVNPDAKKDIPAATQELVNMGFLPSDINGLMNEPSTMEIDPSTGLAIERIHQMQRGADNVMGLRVNGENRYVFFNQNDERAKRMALAIKNLDADKLGAILSTTAEITRFLAAMNTQYNPLFGAYNFLRDVSTAGLQLTDTPLAGKQKEVLNPKSVLGAMHGIYTDLRAERKGGAGKSQWSKLWEEFQQRGGQTGFRDQFSSTEKRGQALQRIVDPSSWAESKLGKVFTAGGTLKVPMETARKAAAPIFNWLSDYNEMMENAIRLSAYKTALDNGMSKDAAAVLAKELTVNFNRKGQIATQAGALYAFFNASVQGTTALIRTLSGPAGKAIVGGGLMMGAIQALLYSVAGFDEGEPPEFIREKNFVMPIWNGKEWNGKYIAIPLPLGYNVIPNTSRLITEAAIRFTEGKKVKPTETAFKIFESLLGAFNPIGNAGWSLQTVAPTVVDPFAAIMENKDWTGRRIAREDFNSLDPTPGFTRYKESSSTFSRELAEFMNSMSGGTQDAPGKISPTPDQIDYLIAQIFGGVGREALKIERTIRSQITGEELPPQAIPLAGRFYGDTTGSSAVSSAFYENLKEMNIHENTVKGMRKRKENVQEYFRENPEARMFEEAGRVEREVQALRKRRRELVEKKAPKESVRAIEERITARMKRFNDKIKQREERKK